MTLEDKELLLKDLCARLPYRPKVQVVGNWFYDYREPYDSTLDKISSNLLIPGNSNLVMKPYLRPMSSMTEEELREAKELGIYFAFEGCIRVFDGFGNVGVEEQLKALDWLNSHHFDFRGLIEKGLALEASTDMYKED